MLETWLTKAHLAEGQRSLGGWGGGGLLPFASSLANTMLYSNLSLEIEYVSLKPATSCLWWTPWYFWHWLLGHYLAAGWRVSPLVASFIKLSTDKMFPQSSLYRCHRAWHHWRLMSPSQQKPCDPKPLHHLQGLIFVWDNEQILFPQTSDFQSHSFLFLVHKTLSQSIWRLSLYFFLFFLLISGLHLVVMRVYFLFMKSSAKSRLWYLHSCPLVVVVNSCLRVFVAL